MWGRRVEQGSSGLAPYSRPSLHPSSPVFTRLHPSSPVFSRLHPSSPVFTRLHPSDPAAPVLTRLTRLHPSYTRLHPSLPVFTRLPVCPSTRLPVFEPCSVGVLECRAVSGRCRSSVGAVSGLVSGSGVGAVSGRCRPVSGLSDSAHVWPVSIGVDRCRSVGSVGCRSVGRVSGCRGVGVSGVVPFHTPAHLPTLPHH